MITKKLKNYMSEALKLLITICARSGSKGVPNKNIKLLDGKPLINYSIELAKKVDLAKNIKISISTDSNEIIKIAENNGIYTKYKRPSNLAKDNSSKLETIKHLLEYEENHFNVKYDYVLDLDVSSPLRNLDDIKNSFKIFNNNKRLLSLFSVNKSHRSPYFNMVEKQKNASYYKLIKDDHINYTGRQYTPITYDLNASIYWYRREFFNNNFNSPITKNSGIYLMNHICFDIDNVYDFKIMDFLVKNNELDFDL